MLRAGICDLGTCDVEMGCRVSSVSLAGRDALRPARPPTYRLVRHHELSRPPWRERNENRARLPATPPGMCSAAGRQPAVYSAGRATDLRLYCLAGHNLQHLHPAGTARFPYGRRMFPAGCHAFPQEAVTFPAPVGAVRFHRTPVMFPPECGGVSAGYRGVPPEGGRRLPRVPCAAVPMGPAPEPAAALFPTV
jgi:hypothetical protein